MNYAQALAYCAAKTAAVHDYKTEWEADRVCVADKMFVLMGILDGRPFISLKCEPQRADQLRQAFKDIIPGYYLNKTHWNTLYLDGELPDELVQGCIDESYGLIVGGLSKKRQKELGLPPHSK